MSHIKEKARALAKEHAFDIRVETRARSGEPNKAAYELRDQAEVAAKDFPGHESDFMSAYDKGLEAHLEDAALSTVRSAQRLSAWANVLGFFVVIVVAAVMYLLFG
ncbi:hypothetical protein EHF36_10180 [Kerstersia gyiorum]|uniref:hypothetical protein n=1 Tax=Kerstersia gyiorum TaxID=206506 RepID=UPI0010709C34|nr:hypothetical protein [Kerstersia gyiorum]QBR40951.1 hypothetical protein EHF36_10180 [Kerstersia gyiorum]